jgi:enterochelin esterase-like enzyme
VNFILDNLIAEKKAVPMIILMEKGYATKAGAPTRPGAFEEVVEKDLIPFIDSNFRTKADRKHRHRGAVDGCGHAMRIGLGNLDLFSAVGAFSGGAGKHDVKTAFGGEFSDGPRSTRRWACCTSKPAP